MQYISVMEGKCRWLKNCLAAAVVFTSVFSLRESYSMTSITNVCEGQDAELNWKSETDMKIKALTIYKDSITSVFYWLSLGNKTVVNEAYEGRLTVDFNHVTGKGTSGMYQYKISFTLRNATVDDGGKYTVTTVNARRQTYTKKLEVQSSVSFGKPSINTDHCAAVVCTLPGNITDAKMMMNLTRLDGSTITATDGSNLNVCDGGTLKCCVTLNSSACLDNDICTSKEYKGTDIPWKFFLLFLVVIPVVAVAVYCRRRNNTPSAGPDDSRNPLSDSNVESNGYRNGHVAGRAEEQPLFEIRNGGLETNGRLENGGTDAFT